MDKVQLRSGFFGSVAETGSGGDGAGLAGFAGRVGGCTAEKVTAVVHSSEARFQGAEKKQQPAQFAASPVDVLENPTRPKAAFPSTPASDRIQNWT